MTPQISFIGLELLTVFYFLCAGLLTIFWRLIPTRRTKQMVVIPLAVVLVVLPWVDEMWIGWHFQQACKDAGVHVVRKVEVEGFYDNTMRSGYELIDRYGYAFMEHPSNERGKVGHVEKVDGKWRETVLEQPTARYVYKFTDPRQEIPIGYQLEKVEMIIVDSQTSEIIGRDTRFKRYSGGLWMGLFARGLMICNGPLDQPEKQKRYGLLYHYVLIPTNKN